MTIFGLEDMYNANLKTALKLLFPEADIEVFKTYMNVVPFGRADLVVTDMMMPTGLKSRDLEYAGAAAMLKCMKRDTPAVCLSASYHHAEEVNFGNHLLRAVDLEMVDEVDKKTPKGWLNGLKSSFRGHVDHWTVKPRTGIRSAIQGYVPQRPTNTPYDSMEDSPSW